MEYILSMTFVNQADSKTTLTISGVKPDISAEEVKSLMQLIIDKEFFLTSKGLLINASTAQLTQREVTKFEVK
ncbi:DUF2922 domain-containing protein [Clostridium botulinum]|uniref:DUF2922 domain-containing protein n=2 Tax=Clostridium TaxID=1485 RepID=UPI0004FFA03E|nr:MULTISPECIES: DUF2922 domain-containing protein [unclassified Clostridium]KFX54006.1 hypothetical protein KU40_18860 [Clostridium botulinum]MBY6779802.1 DUF2922 domain-containing protein [Clostridium botulinum]MBY6852998.1 DUF2922 domain-containing protein [Clostridium botulinum]MBY7007387.1 DUF2922 domain-containing protein [Clostridium botulinum]NFH71738.1 DUF2922 domain-containing protein [Clostridium botulinum]